RDVFVVASQPAEVRADSLDGYGRHPRDHAARTRASQPGRRDDRFVSRRGSAQPRRRCMCVVPGSGSVRRDHDVSPGAPRGRRGLLRVRRARQGRRSPGVSAMKSSLLAIHGGPKAVDQPAPHFVWPGISETTRAAVMRQLDESISIYDRSGIIEDLECSLEDELEVAHALLFNSGTSALFAMFAGLELAPGDEVICPDYTFFASASPLFILGARPVLVDCRGDGNIDPAQIERAF